MLLPTAEPFFFPGGNTGCLLVHGFTGTPKEMRLLGETLAKHGFSALGVRLTGHATQPEDMIRSRWQDWYASVEDGYHLLHGISESIFIIGLSMGGVLSLLISSRFPVSGVVALATPHHAPDDPRIPYIKLISLFKPFVQKGTPQWYDSQALADHVSYPVEPTRAYSEVIELIKVMQAELPNVTAPTLLINSHNDPTVKAADNHMERIFEEIGSQDKQMLWVENSGHVITRDQAREQVFTAVIDFVERVTGASS